MKMTTAVAAGYKPVIRKKQCLKITGHKKMNRAKLPQFIYIIFPHREIELRKKETDIDVTMMDHQRICTIYKNSSI